MLQKLLLILLPVFSALPVEDHLIEWSASRKLTWEDFQGKVDPGSTNAALTSSGINAEFSFNDKQLLYTIRCRFDKSKSWVRIKNDYILSHEQRHFDIAEVHARLLHKELSAYRFNAATVNKDINEIYNKVIRQHVGTQKQYDLETNHSLDTVRQKSWDAKIDAMLVQYKKWANYRQH